MGTRGLTKVIFSGEPVVAQYGQWDHYPEGQGLDALQFLTDASNVEALRSNIGKVRDITEEEAGDLMEQAGIERDAEYMTWAQADKFRSLAPQLDRNMGAGILAYVAKSGEDEILVQRDVEFDKDRLWCEGVIIVDLDNNTFTWSDGGWGSSEIRNFTYPLDDLPTEDKFLEDTAYPEEGDE